MPSLHEASVLKFVSKSLETSFFVHLILDLVIFEHFIRCRLEVVCKGLKWRLQIISIINLGLFFFIKIVVGLEQVAEVLVVLCCVDLPIKLWPDYEPACHLHELLDNFLMGTRKNWEALLIRDKCRSAYLNSVNLFAGELAKKLSGREIWSYTEQ